MLTRKVRPDQAGFTLAELAISIFLIGIISTTLFTFFRSSFFNYLNLQTDATATSQIMTQSNRIAQVLRGVTDISDVDANEFEGHSYFYPSDAYVSVIHYYLQTSGGKTKLMADRTPMNANPPIGSPITSKKVTFTVIDSFYQPSGTSLFTYLDASGNALSLPITDLQTIKAIRVNLAAKGSNNTNQKVDVQVGLRNRKTNL